jgi:hypothetical protein
MGRILAHWRGLMSLKGITPSIMSLIRNLDTYLIMNECTCVYE